MRSRAYYLGMFVLLACGGGASTAPDGGGYNGGNGGGGGGGSLVHAKLVTAGSSTFTPSTETIAVNDTIYYRFGAVTHNVTFASTTGAPANIPDSYSTTVKRRFETAGTFDYHCTIHAGMNGSIVVQ